MPRLLFIFTFLTSICTFAQKEASIWYFGQGAGLNFNTGNPVILTNGQTMTDEGVASISDANGQLLFYTDGTTIWNRNHTIMPNGTGLLGHISSSQSAIVVPMINDPSRYYVFTIAQLGEADGFKYSVVNMNLDLGRGDVEVKNISLQSQVCEKLTAVKHCNGRDTWVIVHGFNAATFHAYLVTAAGVNTSPVVSTAGRFVPNTNSEFAIGCMKVSPNGKKIAIAHKRQGADLLDFDNSTGIVSNGNSLFLSTETYGSYRGAYGVEFSPNSKYLYVCGDYFDFSIIQESSYILQYDVSLADHAMVQASKQLIYQQQSHWAAENFGTLQTGPDGHIYMAELSQNYVSVINNPNLGGAACGFVYAGVNTWTAATGGGRSRYGLPAFIQSFFKSSFSFRGACSGNLLYFDYERSTEELSVKWDFGDPLSGANNTSTLDSAQHLFTAEGIYTVSLIRYTACGNDTISKPVSVGAGQVNLGNDSLLCGQTQFLIIPQLTGTQNTYLWQDGYTGPDFTATQDGIYWVQVINTVNGCSKRDSITLTFKPDPVFTLGNDQKKCDNDIVNLSVNLPASFIWSTGNSSNSQQVTGPGTYWVDVTQEGCTKRDSINILYYSYPILNLGKDTVLCEGMNLLLDSHNPATILQWQDNSSASTFMVSHANTYWVKAANNGCVSTDTILVDYLNKPDFTLGQDTSFCQGMTLKLSPFIRRGEDVDFSWNTGLTDTSIVVMQEGLYSLTATNQCGSQTDDIRIKKGICKLYVPSAFTPDNDGHNDVFRALFGENLVDFELTVYNRWGEIVFRSKDIAKGWDGRFKGRPQDSDIFVWLIRYSVINEPGNKMMKGTVMLIR